MFSPPAPPGCSWRCEVSGVAELVHLILCFCCLVMESGSLLKILDSINFLFSDPDTGGRASAYQLETREIGDKIIHLEIKR